LGDDAAVRLLRAKVNVLQDELNAALADLARRGDECAALRREAKDQGETASKLQRANATLQSNLEKQRRESAALQVTIDDLQRALSSARKDGERADRLEKQLETQGGDKQVRLNRAREEVERLKEMLKEERATRKKQVEDDRQSREALLADNKRLAKHKAELVSGLKKQMKLVDVLKRQKMHLEAAKLLSFTEDEFTKALDLGDRS